MLYPQKLLVIEGVQPHRISQAARLELWFGFQAAMIIIDDRPRGGRASSPLATSNAPHLLHAGTLHPEAQLGQNEQSAGFSSWEDSGVLL